MKQYRYLLPVGIVAGIVAVGTIFIARAVARSEPVAPQIDGSGVPPIGSDFIIAVLVQVEGPDVAQDALLYVGRKTFNRLRDESGAARECDREGMQLQAVVGQGAQAWSIPAGARVILTQLRHGVPVPATVVAGDDWFLSGEEWVSPPCDGAVRR
jgi:hypothetical protein